jgi:hypothetical protein
MAKHRSLAKQSRGLGPRNAAKRGRVADRYPISRRHRDPNSARNLHKNTQFLSKPRKRAANLQRIIGAWQKSSASVTDRGFPALAERLAAEIGTGGQAVWRFCEKKRSRDGSLAFSARSCRG